MNSLLNFPSLIPPHKVSRRPKLQAVAEFEYAKPQTDGKCNENVQFDDEPPPVSTFPKELPPPPPEPTPMPVYLPALTPRSVAPADCARGKSGAGPLWIVCAYFNPCKYKKRRSNYEMFMSNLLRQNVPVCTVELASSPETAELTTLPIATASNASGSYQNIHHVIYSTSVLWAKEVLLNIGETLLPPDCKFVCWADADLTWDDDNWAAKVVALMSRSDGPVVIQPFEMCHQMKPNETYEKDYKNLTDDERMKNACMPIARQYTTQPLSYINTGNPFKFHAGYAWVIRRDIMNDMGGLFEYCILGQADYCMALAFTHDPRRDRDMGRDWNIDGTFNWGARLLETIRTWQQHASTIVKGRLGFLSGVRVYHSFHGHPANRQYSNRGRLINDLNPHTDLAKDESGMLCFTSAAQARGLPDRVKKYFEKRQEDSDENPNRRFV